VPGAQIWDCPAENAHDENVAQNACNATTVPEGMGSGDGYIIS